MSEKLWQAPGALFEAVTERTPGVVRQASSRLWRWASLERRVGEGRDDDQAVGREAAVGVAEVGDLGEDHAGGDQEGDGDGELGGDQGLAHPAARAAAAGRAGRGQDRGGLEARQDERRIDARAQPDRHGGGERHGPGARRSQVVEPERQPAHGVDEGQGQLGQAKRDQGRDRRGRRRLAHELQDQGAPVGAQRLAHRHLARPQACACAWPGSHS